MIVRVGCKGASCGERSRFIYECLIRSSTAGGVSEKGRD